MDEQITSRPGPATTLLTKEDGVWIFRVGEPLAASATEEVIRKIREERDVNNLGL